MALMLSEHRNGLPFPTEITEQVFSYLTKPWQSKGSSQHQIHHSDQQALKNARLTCKSFHTFASPLLFRRLVISPFLMQLATGMKVSDRPVFAQGVTELAYDPNISPLPRIPWQCLVANRNGRSNEGNLVKVPICFNCVANAPRLPPIHSCIGHNFEVTPYRSYYQVLLKRLQRALIGRPKAKLQSYISCRAEHMAAEQDIDITNHLEQELILRDGRDQFCMWHLFQALPKLRKLSYGCCDDRWFPFLSEMIPLIDIEYPPLPRSPPLPPRPFRYVLGSYGGNLKKFPGFTSITHALAYNEDHINEVEIRVPLDILRMSAEDANDTCEAFKKLTNLSLTFSFVEPPLIAPGQPLTPIFQNHFADITGILLRKYTADMFGNVHGLQSMTLRLEAILKVPSEYHDIVYSVPLSHTIGGTHWGSLQNVSLKGLDFTEAEFIEFLEDHLNTLTTIELEQINLSEGEWSKVIAVCDRMPNLKVLSLDHVQEYHQVDYYWKTYNGVRRSGAYEGTFQWEKTMRLIT
ncbi:hypothetical protein MMC30_000382 [Trapelia coarctata]|nr:hypothetical protein [Trapelia coarctata]